MLERLANVIYWLGCALSALVLAITVLLFVQSGDIYMAIFFVVIAVLIWVAGRAIRYILIGR
jgi:hypothetical protein